MGKSSIYHIAEITGFSPATVSRAISGSGYCSDKTRAIIQKAAKEIDFQPSMSARALKSRRTNRILFCIPDICNPYYFNMIRGATDVFDKYGVYLMLCYTRHNLSEELKFINLLMGQYGDGMIFVSFDFNKENIGAIKKCGCPVVLTNLYENKHAGNFFDCVYVDHTRAIYLATEHLICLGHRKIALVVGSPTEQTSRERRKGFETAMQAYNIPYHDSNVFLGDYTKASGEAAGRQLTACPDRFTGVVCANDLMALGVMSACVEQGIGIPNELSIVSLDNTDFTTAVHPQLSSVDMMQYAIGQNAATMLMERINKDRDYSKTIRLEPSLVLHQSTAPLIQL